MAEAPQRAPAPQDHSARDEQGIPKSQSRAPALSNWASNESSGPQALNSIPTSQPLDHMHPHPLQVAKCSTPTPHQRRPSQREAPGAVACRSGWLQPTLGTRGDGGPDADKHPARTRWGPEQPGHRPTPATLGGRDRYFGGGGYFSGQGN